MIQSSHIVHRSERNTSSFDEHNQLICNSTLSSLQSYVDDIPFEFNVKYRPKIISNIKIAEYNDTSDIHEILSRKIDFKLEHQILTEVLNELKQKRKKIQDDILREQTNTSNSNFTKSRISDSSRISFGDESQVKFSSYSHTRTLPSAEHPCIINTSAPLKTVSFSSSVHNIRWPFSCEQGRNTSISTDLSSVQWDPIRHASHTINKVSSTFNNDLSAAFDQTLSFDDPFHEAELKSLNAIAELNKLYTATSVVVNSVQY